MSNEKCKEKLKKHERRLDKYEKAISRLRIDVLTIATILIEKNVVSKLEFSDFRCKATDKILKIDYNKLMDEVEE